ncbi:ABC transporter ATP-binding protein [Spiribacter roseus]|uniref:ABC transporter ATP-binding protein n=1 Tax=Spiribacter roseus TaxID=1855875 RepID=A0ABV3RZ81_9GAMM
MMAVGMAVLETAGVASVMPFLSVLGNPVLATAYEWGGFASVDAFLMALGIGAFVLIVTSAVFRAVTLYAITRWSMMRMHSLSERLLETYLRQPYAYFLDRHSGDMSKTILTEAQQVTTTVIRPGMDVIAHGTVLAAIVVLLVVVDPVLAVAVAGVIGGAYALIYVGVRGFLGRIGKDRVRANKERFTAAGEALGGIKDVKLLGREHAYLSRFRGPSTRFARHQAASQVLGQVPKFLIEAIGFGGIIVLTLVLMAANGGVSGGGLGGVLPVLGLYAFAGYRMLPAAQNVYQGIAQLRFGSAAVDTVYDDLHRRASLAEIHKTAPAPMQPEREIALDRVTYHYPRATQSALADINLTIPVGSSVGLVGSTGAGKTTLVDVILGLLRPTDGAITVDGEAVTDGNLRAWQAALGYVPQDIFLTDATVTENIAFGIDPEQIDAAQVERCARMAQVHDFVTQEMPQGYDTIVGERGVRLSGGQRQRIGVARALYHDPDILVFDEATSALDTVTERAVMEAIDALHHQKTIILIAHRLSTVAGCDQVVLLEHGKVEAKGAFDALKDHSTRFRTMALGQ